MSLYDHSARQDHETPRRAPLRDLFRRHPRRRPRTSDPSGPSARARRREARRLALMDRRLVAETPRLASMFTMFNALNSAERTGGAETLPPPVRRRLPPTYLAFLVALAAVAALCFALASQMQAVARPCSPSSVVAMPAAGAAAAAPVGTGACASYASNSGGRS